MHQQHRARPVLNPAVHCVRVQEKSTYRSRYALLTEKKAEIERLQAEVQGARARVQEAFREWRTQQSSQ